ncbi:MAG: hypothetical protein F2934_03220 [Actinobacteria bacterium]|uniref:Unannotated protein n=1 Tax=freshwater metagenome TaxID=449393 RepID=A0A6J6R1E1_9ZZZZ|nr:hypothetical protein [Actinomycetota bacterium]MSZ03059.1 hypothetical protein [Actinomycetota bacterium]MTB06125.1 hypothetical protein [Actinomycetota bacterium]
MTGRADEIAERLSVISDEIADLAIDSIREALRSGPTARPAAEKQLTQARRAVEKAAYLLRGVEDEAANSG